MLFSQVANEFISLTDSDESFQKFDVDMHLLTELLTRHWLRGEEDLFWQKICDILIILTRGNKKGSD